MAYLQSEFPPSTAPVAPALPGALPATTSAPATGVPLVN